MKLHTSLAALFVSWLVALTSLSAQEMPFLSAHLVADDNSAAGADEPYRSGRQALDQGRWAEAVEHFAKSAAAGTSHSDAAHYWWAYALHKDGHSSEASEVLETLRRDFDQSDWLDDASALQIEIEQQRSGRSARRGSRDRDNRKDSAGDDDNELKLLALNALMHNDSARALPMLEKFLAGDHPVELRERALFVLSQSETPKAAQMLLDVARGDQHPELQMRAVHYLGLSDIPEAVDALQAIYRSSNNSDVKAAVLHSFMLSDAIEPVLELARNEPDADLRQHAIHQLGIMNAHEVLRDLYRSETTDEVKARILHSMFIADDTEALVDIARTESNEEMRRKAIHSLGLVDSAAASTALGEIYTSTSDVETRKAIIRAHFLSDNVEQLIEIARTESNLELRKVAIQQLSLIDDDQALDFMMELLEQ